MAITKTKEQIYEWFTTKNWFKSYEKNLFRASNPHERVTSSGCSNFKDYLDYAYRKLREESISGYIEFLLCDFNRDNSDEGYEYWHRIDQEYWFGWVRKN